jgi:hypothetical protein
MMLNLRMLALAATGGMLVANQAAAATIHDRSQWQRLTPPEKALYLAGYADRQGQELAGAGDEYVAQMTGEARCMRELFPKPFDLARVVDDGYERDAANADDNPGLVFSRHLAKICRTYVNEERAKLRLTPLP